MNPTPDDLVETLLDEGIRDARLIEAFRTIPREGFVPGELAAQAYLDRPLPIPHGQVTTQPSLIAWMVEALALEGSEKVLEVGTGYGFQTALLACMAGFVWSVERWPELAKTARANLSGQGLTNVEVVVGDGTEGLAEHAPFQAVVVSAAFPEVPRPLIEQLGPGGRLVQPIGSGGNEVVELFEKGVSGLERRGRIIGAHFVRLYGTHGFPLPRSGA